MEYFAGIKNKFDDDLESKADTLPGLDFHLSATAAPWVFGLLTLARLFQMRHQLPRVLLDPDMGTDEPRLVLEQFQILGDIKGRIIHLSDATVRFIAANLKQHKGCQKSGDF